MEVVNEVTAGPNDIRRSFEPPTLQWMQEVCNRYLEGSLAVRPNFAAASYFLSSSNPSEENIVHIVGDGNCFYRFIFLGQ